MFDLKKRISRIRTGGQSGVDRAAMDFAREQGIPLCGWCPKNGWAEDYPDPPGLLSDYPELTETPSAGTEQRTIWNMRDCDAVLTIMPGGSVFSPGTMIGLEEGINLSRPMFTAAGPEDVPEIIKWISCLPDGTELCIGGPRASEWAQAYDKAKAVLNGIAEACTRKAFRIETDRLIICEFTPDMAEAVHRNSLDEDNRRFVPDEVFETVGDAQETVDFLIGRYDGTEGPFVYPVLLKSGENIGYIQLVPIDEGWEIGYHIAKSHTGRGYATEAVKAFLPVMAEQHDLSEIYGICLAENTASACVMEKSGFLPLFRGPGLYQGRERNIVKNIWKR